MLHSCPRSFNHRPERPFLLSSRLNASLVLPFLLHWTIFLLSLSDFLPIIIISSVDAPSLLSDSRTTVTPLSTLSFWISSFEIRAAAPLNWVVPALICLLPYTAGQYYSLSFLLCRTWGPPPFCYDAVSLTTPLHCHRDEDGTDHSDSLPLMIVHYKYI